MVASVARSWGRGRPRLPCSGPRVALARCRGATSPPAAGLHGLAVPCSHGRHLRRLRGGHVCAASSRGDRPDRGRPCDFREWKPAQRRPKWASKAFVRRKDAACECLSLSEVRLGEGHPVAALSVDSRGLSHERARGMWMVRPNRRGFWRAQPSRTPPPRYGARRERAMARLDRHRCGAVSIRR